MQNASYMVNATKQVNCNKITEPVTAVCFVKQHFGDFQISTAKENAKEIKGSRVNLFLDVTGNLLIV